MPCQIYDNHMHIYSTEPDDAVRILDACGIEKAVILSKGWERVDPNAEHGMWEKAGLEILAKHPDRFAVFSTVDFSRMDDPDFGPGAAAHFAETVARGASGLKLWLGKPDHHWMELHDPRIGAVYDKAAELDVPILIHVGDPQDYWEDPTPDSFWYAILKDNPQWLFKDRPVASRERLFAEQRLMLERYPGTTFIIPHLGGHAENLVYLSELLDTFPNLFVDTAGYEPLLGQNPQESRDFILRYQDRILVGTDNGWTDEGLDTLRRRLRSIRLFYETTETQRDLDEFMPRRPGYEIRGIGLPPDALTKIYRDNVARLVPSLAG